MRWLWAEQDVQEVLKLLVEPTLTRFPALTLTLSLGRIHDGDQ